MTPTLCTLFDQNYLVKGLALIRSLQRHHTTFHLFVLALDAETERAALALNDKRVIVVPLERIETDDLRAVKAQRTQGEYCWTLTPHFVKWLLADVRIVNGATTSAWHLENVVYLDADSYLFAPLDTLYAEIDTTSVAIIPHRFPPRLAWRERENGIYNVNFVYFKNDETGRRAVGEWSAQCLEWCYQRSERDAHGMLRFGDQAYLDEWTDKYNAHVIQHLGANLAPWNQEGYRYTFEQQLFIIKHRALGEPGVRAGVTEGTPIERIDRLLFYHFHEHDMTRLVNAARQIPYRGGYPLKDEVIEHVYVPYERECRAIEQSLARA